MVAFEGSRAPRQRRGCLGRKGSMAKATAATRTTFGANDGELNVFVWQALASR